MGLAVLKVYKIEAVVLRAFDCGNADKILVLYSKERGKVKVMAHGITKPTSRKRGATQLFSHSRFLINKGRDLDTVSQGEAIEIFSAFRNSLEIIVYASYLVELLEAITPEEEANPQLFELLLTIMHLLPAGEPEMLVRSFEIRLLSLLGYRPLLEQCVGCQGEMKGALFFSPAWGGVLCQDCRTTDAAALPISRGVVESLKLLLSWPPVKLGRFKLDGVAKVQLRNLLQAYIRYLLERNLKSAAFLEHYTGPEMV